MEVNNSLRVVEKELYVYFKTYHTEISYVILFPALLIISMRLGIGDKVEIGDVEYVEFISPGILMMSAVTTALFNTGFIMLFEKEYAEYFQGLITCPITSGEVAFGKILSGTIKSTINGMVILVIVVLLIGIPVSWTLFALSPLVLFVSSLFFSAIGLMLGVYIKMGYQLGTIGNLIILPATFLGGMFFDVNDLPANVLPLARYSPVTMMIDALRKVMIYNDADIVMELSAITAWFLALYVIAVKVFDRQVIE